MPEHVYKCAVPSFLYTSFPVNCLQGHRLQSNKMYRLHFFPNLHSSHGLTAGMARFWFLHDFFRSHCHNPSSETWESKITQGKYIAHCLAFFLGLPQDKVCIFKEFFSWNKGISQFIPRYSSSVKPDWNKAIWQRFRQEITNLKFKFITKIT